MPNNVQRCWACALYNNWWPMLSALMYVLVPMPCLFFGGGSTQFLISRDGGGFVVLEEMPVDGVEQMSELRRHSLQLFYAIRDHPSTMLYNDEDLEVMFAVADSIGLNCIEVTVVDSHGFDSGTSGCGGDVGVNSIGFFDSGGDVGASTSKGISFSGQGLVVHRLEPMGDVGKEDDLGAVVHFLSELPNERWVNVFFPGQRYGAMSSSLAECFNSWILKERELPVLDMVDRIRKKMMKLMCLRRERASKWEQVYSKPIYPVASLLKGDVVDCGTSILPPLSKKPPGRPKKKRIRRMGRRSEK
ncbi:hypothetical protein RHGRI_011224 [Rhododendron griersonianum]|uniref:Uncharacterized protein n=2 Tax=Magnoliopsida TaxID=3398 RepID=A0AAV6KM80_9ERIC|nr:hypothetical protein RHGRI_011224 [Rhododendron griersonianum]